MKLENNNGFKKSQIPWNKGKKSPNMSLKMLGNTNGKNNKGRKFKDETILKMRLAKLGKPSNRRKLFKKPKITKIKIRLTQEQKIERMKAKNKKWLTANYERKLWLNNQRRVRKLGNGGTHTLGEWEILKAQYNWICPSCKRLEPEIKLTRDHIIPLSKGGSDNIENIQPLCRNCNCRKNTLDIKY